MVGAFYHIHVVFDDDHRVAPVHELEEHKEELVYIGKMETRCRLIEDVEGPACIPLGEFPRELDPLGLSAGQGCRCLAEADVPQTDVIQDLQFALDVGDGVKEFHGLGDRHFQNVGNALALVFDLQGVPVVPFSLAHITDYVDIRQELHLDLDKPFTCARFATSALHVEAEPALLVPPYPRFGELCKECADKGKNTRVGRGVRPRCPPDGRLVNVDDPVDRLKACDAVGFSCPVFRLVELLFEEGIEGVDDEGAFPRAGDAGDAGEDPEGYIDVDVLQVVGPGALDLDESSGFPAFPAVSLSAADPTYTCR